MKKELTLDEKENKFERVLQKAYDEKNANAIRHLRRIATKHYLENRKDLRKYAGNIQKKEGLVQGLASSVHYDLTKKTNYIEIRKFGGLGAKIKRSKTKNIFGKLRLQFADIEEDMKGGFKYNTNWF